MQRLIFSINSGRSGSGYLHQVLATAENVTAFHEAKPDMAGPRLSQFPATRPTVSERLIYPVAYARKFRKVKAIRETLRELSPDGVYAETNHMFILSFYDVIMRHFSRVNVILLRRYLPRVVKSYIDLGMFTPQAASRTSCWTSSPNSPSAAVPALAPDDQLDQFDRCIAYLIDVEARAARFRSRFPHVGVVETRLEELNDLDCVGQMFDRLELPLTDATRGIVGKAVNQKLDFKQESQSVSEEYCLDRIHQYIEKCQQKGISLPDLPHLIKR